MYKESLVNKTKVRILFIHYGDNWIRGSEDCLISMIRNIDKRIFEPFVICNQETMKQALIPYCSNTSVQKLTVLFGWDSPRFDLKSYLKQVLSLNEYLKTNHIDIVHCNSAVPNQSALPVCRVRNIPCVTQLHSPYLRKERTYTGIHFSDYLVGVSHYVSQGLIDDGVPVQKVKTIHNGIDIHFLESQPVLDVRLMLGISKETKLFAAVGSLIQRKGFDAIIDAFALANSKQFHLLIIGEGPEREALEQQVLSKRMQNKVSFMGYQENVIGLLKGGVDCFISGARDEAFGLVFAEAGLAAIPCIAPSVGGIPEVIKDGSTGLLYKSGDIDQLAKHINLIMSNDMLSLKLGEAAKERVLRLFSLDKNLKTFESLYLSLVLNPTKLSFNDYNLLIKNYLRYLILILSRKMKNKFHKPLSISPRGFYA